MLPAGTIATKLQPSQNMGIFNVWCDLLIFHSVVRRFCSRFSAMKEVQKIIVVLIFNRAYCGG